MAAGAVSSIVNGQDSVDPVAVSRAQSELSAKMLVEMFALRASTEMQEAAALALLQTAMGVGESIDTLA
jgi:hypothetical protein